jgi:hypothetical protein
MSSLNLSAAKTLLTKQPTLTKVIFTSAIFLMSSSAICGTICELPWNWNLKECVDWRARERAKRNINFDSENRLNEQAEQARKQKALEEEQARIEEQQQREEQEKRERDTAFQTQQEAEQARVQQQIASQGCIFSRIINSPKSIFTVVSTDGVKFRSSPEYRNDNVYMRILPGQQVAIAHKLPVCSSGQLYFRANYNGQTGWISEGTVSKGYFLN